MNELDHILEVHRRETRWINAAFDAIVILTVLAVGLIVRACGS